MGSPAMRGRCNGGLRWYFNFIQWEPDELEIVRAFASIQEEERVRIQKFAYEADAKASLAGRLMLRRAVALLTNQKNNEFKLGRSSRGRPFLGGHDGLQVNVSHAGQMTVLAANHQPAGCEQRFLLGVDVMPIKDSRIDRTENFFHLMRRQFTENEWESIRQNCDEEAQLQSFYRHWCLKESYVKAVGTGLNIDLRSIEFRLNSELNPYDKHITEDTKMLLNGKPSGWKFEESLLMPTLMHNNQSVNDGHVVCVATNERVTSENQPWTELNASDLFPPENDYIKDKNDEDWNIFNQKLKKKPF